MHELFQQNAKDYFDKLTIKDFVNRNNLQPNPDTEWPIIVSLTVCSYKDNEFKDFLNKRDYLKKSICADFLENFERFHDHPLITGLYYYYKFQISRQKAKLNSIKSYINTQSNKSLRNKLISLAKSFNSYKRSFDSKQTLCNGVSDIISIFTPNSLSFLRENIKSLRESLEDTFESHDFNLEQFKLKDCESSIKNTYSFMFTVCKQYKATNDFKLKDKITLPPDFKEEISELINELDKIIAGIPNVFDESTLPLIVKIDFFLQCSWLVSLVYSTIAHPPAQIFKKAYLPDENSLPDGSFDKIRPELEDDELMEKIIDQMGKKRQLEFDYATDILDAWRSELRKFDKRYKSLYFHNQQKTDLINIIEKKQLEEEETTNDENETQELVYNFPDEFSAFPNSMSEIKDIIENQIISFLHNKEGEEEAQVEEEEEEYEEYEVEEEEEEGDDEEPKANDDDYDDD